MNEKLRVEYLQNDVRYNQEMTKYELVALLLDEDIFLLSAKADKRHISDKYIKV